MSDDKTANPRNTSPGDKTKGSGQPELKEEELDKVSGGATYDPTVGVHNI